MKGKIEKFDNLGRGILYSDGKITFIPKTCPGDVIEYRIDAEYKNYNEGSLVRIVTPSKMRVQPKCPFYDVCGGCDLEHISYEDTINYKLDNIKYLLNKNDFLVDVSVIKNPKPYNYRNKITLKIVNGKIGYYESKTNNIVPIDNCLLASQTINEVISNIDSFNIMNGNITIRSNELDEVLLSIDTEDKVNLDSINDNVIGIVINGKLEYGFDTINENINDIIYQISYNSFFQVNPYVASKIFDIVKKNVVGNNVLDLYCGVGAIALQVAEKVENVIGVEIVENAISNAMVNAKVNSISNATFILKDSKDAVSTLDNNYDTIIVDPPRIGLSKEVSEYLNNSNAKRVIYVSCNPQTLMRDLSILKEKYIIIKFYIADMFSYTEHCESITVLERR